TARAGAAACSLPARGSLGDGASSEDAASGVYPGGGSGRHPQNSGCKQRTARHGILLACVLRPWVLPPSGPGAIRGSNHSRRSSMLNRPNLRHLPGLLALLLACPVAAQEFTTPRPSPNAKVIQTVGTTEMSVSYSRPGVKNRVVWGGLVPWGKAWRTGANEITQFQSADDVWVEGQKLAAGTYALVTTPNPDAVTFAFSTQKDMAGLTGYDPKTNVLSVTVKPVPAPHVERMQFTFDEPTTDEVTLTLRWEKLAVPLRLR